MSEVTLESIEELMDGMLDRKLEPIKAVLNSHTATLAILTSKVSTKDDIQTVNNHRLDRLEKWGKKVGNKVDIKLEL